MKASFLICTNVCDLKTMLAIRSCLNQETRFAYEVVIIANGPRKLEIQKKLNESFGNKIIVYCSDLLGLVNNLNYGLSRCAGEYILRFDADDICMENRVQKQIGFMVDNQSIDVSYGNAILIDGEGQKVGKYLSANSSAFWFLVFRNYINHPSVCFKKSVVDKIGGYREKTASEDYDLWLRLKFLKKAVFAHVGSDLIFYRDHSENGFRRNFKAYWSATIFKSELAIISYSPRLLFGAFFSCVLAILFSFKSIFSFLVWK